MEKEDGTEEEGGEEIVTADSECTHRILMFPPLQL